MRARGAQGPRAGDGTRYADIGGADLLFCADPYLSSPSIDIAGNGDIYVAFEYGDWIADNATVAVMRSQDGGDTWEIFGDFYSTPAHNAGQPSIHIAEGVTDQCFVAFYHEQDNGDNGIRLASSPLSGSVGSWSFVDIAFTISDYEFASPCVITDADSYDQYYVYVVFQRAGTDQSAIYFRRSTNQGGCFEDPYWIASVSGAGAVYASPQICHGLGGFLHVVWFFHTDGDFNGGIRYRRAESFAGGGSSSWGALHQLTSIHNDYHEMLPRVAASLVSADVVVTYTRMEEVGGDWQYTDPGLQRSHDQGSSFPAETILPDGMRYPCTLVQDPGTGHWIMGGWSSFDGGACLQRASAANPTVWSPVEVFADIPYDHVTDSGMPLALDPMHDHRAAIVWASGPHLDHRVLFDAEWRSDPGYPIHAPGFPLLLDHEPASPPALVDLDHDSELEIVYGDSERGVHAYHHDGSIVAGWPITLARDLGAGPVAVGPLSWEDDLHVVAGTADGWVYAYDASGNLLPGWPQDMGTGSDAYVSIGSLGDPEGRTIVIASDNVLTFRNLQGELPQGARPHWLGRRFSAPCAIGDIDGDPVPEIVCGLEDQVVAWKMYSPYSVFSRILPSYVSDAVTLGDLDLDGELEILVPTDNGVLYALNEDGGDVPSQWPFDSGEHDDLTSAAIADCMGQAYPEVAVASKQAEVYLVHSDGTPQGESFPVQTLWVIHGAPVIGTITGWPDIIVTAMEGGIWSWDTHGNRNPGWPFPLSPFIRLSPAYGDLDADGLTEVVVLAPETLFVLDVRYPPSAAHRTWPMYGHDAQHTGCANCEEHLPPSSAPEGEDASITSLAFRSATLHAPAQVVEFSFDLPYYAGVALQIFDVQGRCVQTVVKTEFAAGRHDAQWDGCDRQGADVAAGPYFARLRVRGDGREQTLTRKLLLTR